MSLTMIFSTLNLMSPHRPTKAGLILLGWLLSSSLLAAAKMSGEQIFFSDNGVHIDIGVPRQAFLKASRLNWQELSELQQVPYLIFGWGEAIFLSEHDTWDSVTVSDLWTAAFRSPASAVRIVLSPYGARQDDHILELCPTNWQRLVQRLDQSITQSPTGRPLLYKRQLGKQRILLQSPLQYSWDYNCNHWVAEIMNEIGLPTPWLVTSSDALMSKLPSLQSWKAQQSCNASPAAKPLAP